jgi:hypothetical protein
VFCSLRWGELAALPLLREHRRGHHLRARERGRARPWPARHLSNQVGGRQPRRDDTAVPFLLPDAIAHLEDFTAPTPRALVFTGPQGAQLRWSNFTRQWTKATDVAGLPGFHFHDQWPVAGRKERLQHLGGWRITPPCYSRSLPLDTGTENWRERGHRGHPSAATVPATRLLCPGPRPSGDTADAFCSSPPLLARRRPPVDIASSMRGRIGTCTIG